MEDEDTTPKIPPGLVPRVLDTLSLQELETYIGELEAEIGRARTFIASKKGVRANAEQLFRK